MTLNVKRTFAAYLIYTLSILGWLSAILKRTLNENSRNFSIMFSVQKYIAGKFASPRGNLHLNNGKKFPLIVFLQFLFSIVE